MIVMAVIFDIDGNADRQRRPARGGDQLMAALLAKGEQGQRDAHLRAPGAHQDLVDSKTCGDCRSLEAGTRHLRGNAAAIGALQPDEAIAVDDAPYDAEAGAGVRTVGVLSGGFPEEVLCKAGCIAIYGDPADLLINYAACR
jgi:hypothetical protein